MYLSAKHRYFKPPDKGEIQDSKQQNQDTGYNEFH